MTIWEQLVAMTKLIPGFVAEGIRDFDRRLREATKSLADRQAEENRLAALGEGTGDDCLHWKFEGAVCRHDKIDKGASPSSGVHDDARRMDAGYASGDDD